MRFFPEGFPSMTDPVILDEWIASLVHAVEVAGPQRLEVEGKVPLMVVPIDLFRTLVGERPSFIDMMRNFGRPDTELPGEQTPFNVAGLPVPHKF